jgi:predicted TIM-barrel fold metal-dependent hydrolase
VAPFYEDDISLLKDLIGADHLLFGSDWPHAEGLAEPTAFIDDIPGFTADETRLVMHDNAAALAAPGR